jgi:hypothetical protein
VPDGPVPVEDDRVDRAEGRGVRREFVEVRDDRLLAGVRDVEAVVAEPPGVSHQVARRVRAEAEAVDVDAPVQQAQAVVVRLALVQGGTERGPDPGSDETDEVRGHAAGLFSRRWDTWVSASV